jgi:mannan endo-1,4-beta-mannosidase
MEGSGGWFWWGTKGPEAYVGLWKFLYDRLTYHHGINNLIWIWNGQAAEWYPGDEYVDIIGEDIYTEKRDYSSQSYRFFKATEYPGAPKLVTLAETGVVPDIGNMFDNGVCWSWYTTWCDDFVVNRHSGVMSEEYTEKYIHLKNYASDRSYTLSKLPDIKNYRLD